MSTRDASVPSEWLPLFIGRHIWTKPSSRPQAEPARFCELLDVWETNATQEERGAWYLRCALVDWDGTPTVTRLAQKTHTHEVPESECAPLELEDGATMWLWTPPIDDPPDIEQRPAGWAPTHEEPAPEPEPEEIAPNPSGDQGSLF